MNMSHTEVRTKAMSDWLEKFENRQDATDLHLEKMVFHWLRPLVEGKCLQIRTKAEYSMPCLVTPDLYGSMY